MTATPSPDIAQMERDDIKLDRLRGSFRLTYMTHARNYVMVRHPNCIPFVMGEKEWRALPIVPSATRTERRTQREAV